MTTIRLRRGTAAAWTAANPVLASGEPGVETDTGRQKVGDGVTAWNDLDYVQELELAAHLADAAGAHPVSSVLPNVFHIDNYGAVGDGVTDDTEAIQDALDAADTAGGGTVLGDRSKVYHVAIVNPADAYAYALRVFSNTIVDGLNLDIDWEVGGYPLKHCLGVADDVQENITIRNCVLNGNLVGDTLDETGCGIAVQGTNITVENNEIHHFGGDGIKCGESGPVGGRNITLKGNFIHECGGQGIALDNIDGYLIDGNHIYDTLNTAGGAAESIINSSTNTYGVIVNNVCINWGTIYVGHADCVVQGNTVKSASGAQACITISELATRVNVVNNNLDCTNAAAGAGITGVFLNSISALQAHDEISIIGNTIRRGAATGGSGNAGISCILTHADTLDLLISGNRVYNGPSGAQFADIAVASTTYVVTGLNIVGNICSSPTTAINVGGTGGAASFTINNNVCRLGGILITKASEGVVSGNYVKVTVAHLVFGSRGCIQCYGMDDSLVIGNNLQSTFASSSGVVLAAGGTDSTNNTIIGNHIDVVTDAFNEHAAAGNTNNKFLLNRVVSGAVTVTGTGSVATPVAVTGDRSDGTALTNLLTALASTSLITDSTVA